MPHSGSAFNTSSKTFCDARYQNECWYSIPWSKSFCASGLHDVSKCTLPSFPSSTCPKAECASEMLIVAVTAATIADADVVILTSFEPGAYQATNDVFGVAELLRPMKRYNRPSAVPASLCPPT